MWVRIPLPQFPGSAPLPTFPPIPGVGPSLVYKVRRTPPPEGTRDLSGFCYRVRRATLYEDPPYHCRLLPRVPRPLLEALGGVLFSSPRERAASLSAMTALSSWVFSATYRAFSRVWDFSSSMLSAVWACPTRHLKRMSWPSWISYSGPEHSGQVKPEISPGLSSLSMVVGRVRPAWIRAPYRPARGTLLPPSPPRG